MKVLVALVSFQGITGKKVWTWPSQAPWQRGVETQANGKFRSLPYLGTTWPSAAGNPLTLAPAVAATTDCDEAERPVPFAPASCRRNLTTILGGTTRAFVRVKIDAAETVVTSALRRAACSSATSWVAEKSDGLENSIVTEVKVFGLVAVLVSWKTPRLMV